MKTITVMLDSASRPDLLERTFLSLKEHLKFSEQLYWIHHEAVLDEEKSDQCIAMIRHHGKVDLTIKNIKPLGQGVSITETMAAARGPFFIYWVDDHIAIRDIDLDKLYEVMSTPGINQITFHKRPIMHKLHEFLKKEVNIKGVDLTVSPHWRYMPSIWDLAWIKARWRRHEGPNSHWVLNHRMQAGSRLPGKVKDSDWVIGNMGTYYLGKIGDKAGHICENIGADRGQRCTQNY